jgi:DNA-directed RNA polymerases I, II, and III subunit RPABC3
MSQIILFEDIFDVGQINPDGKKFERVNRLHCRGTTYDIQLTVDVNAELFPCKAGEQVKIVLARYVSTYVIGNSSCCVV